MYFDSTLRLHWSLWVLRVIYHGVSSKRFRYPGLPKPQEEAYKALSTLFKEFPQIILNKNQLLIGDIFELRQYCKTETMQRY